MTTYLLAMASALPLTTSAPTTLAAVASSADGVGVLWRERMAVRAMRLEGRCSFLGVPSLAAGATVAAAAVVAGVRLVIGMASRAVRALGLFGGNADSTQYVCLTGRWLKVRRVHAVPNSAEMVKVSRPFGQSRDQLESHNVGISRQLAYLKMPVSASVDICMPGPTGAEVWAEPWNWPVLVDLHPEPLSKRHGEFRPLVHGWIAIAANAGFVLRAHADPFHGKTALRNGTNGHIASYGSIPQWYSKEFIWL